MAKVTKARLDRRTELIGKIAGLKTEADKYAAEVNEINKAVAADLAASERDSIRRGGRFITLVDGNLSTSWSKAFAHFMPGKVEEAKRQFGKRSRSLSITEPTED